MKRITLFSALFGGLGLAWLALVLPALAQNGPVEPQQPQADAHLYLPSVARNAPASGPTQVDLELSAATIPAGQSAILTATTRSADGLQAFNAFFDVFVDVTGRSEDSGTRIPLVSQANGIYTGLFTPTISGVYSLTVLVDDRQFNDKWPRTDLEHLDVIPIEIVALNLVSASPHQPVMLTGRDAYLNPVPNPSPSAIACETNDPALTPGVAPDPDLPDWRLEVRQEATNYAKADLTCTHLPSGGSDTIPVAYTPWLLRMHNADDMPGLGFNPDSFFDVFVDVRIPGALPGWKNTVGRMEYPKQAGLTFDGCTALSGVYSVGCTFDGSDPQVDRIQFQVIYTPTGSVTGEQTPFKITLTTPPGSATVESYLDINQWLMLDQTFTPIVYNASLISDLSLVRFPFAIKPVKTLNMHIYLVEGSGTITDVNADVAAAENAFFLNALACTCGFYVDFVPTITNIPAADWRKIDGDGDGLDRYDRNGDGDYADPGDNNDLFNAMLLDYFDVSANTENVYYVPGIRGGALGATHDPNRQVAVDGRRDPDNLTLFHEKVHEMDHRKDGDFDVLDSPDDSNNTQGARDPGNAMNYDDTGPWLTKTQCDQLDP